MIKIISSLFRPASRTFARLVAPALCVAAAGLGGGCSTPPQNFATPEAAVDALVVALRNNNDADLKRILGSDADALLSSGDEVADANGRATVVKLYDEKHNLSRGADGSMTLEVGATDWPAPIPIVQGKDGWYFDTAAGIDEALSRRIGRNELFTIQVCLAIDDAQREYAAADYNGDGWREYARKFKSDPGKKNGLYWPTTPGEPDSPLGELVATATAEGYAHADPSNNAPQPYHGYLYRILTAQGPAAPGGAMNFVCQGHMIGGFGVVAWPAEYGNSGLKSFIVSHHGVVYEKDLGDETDGIARAMTVFNPDAGWERAATPEP
jgi:hypothetical protein